MKNVIATFGLLLIIPMLFAGTIKLGDEYEDDSTNDNSFTEQVKSLGRLFKHREFVLFTLIGMLTSVYASCEAFLPFVATRIGLDYDAILSLFAVITIINVIISLFLGAFSDKRDKKILYLIDIGSDFIPVMIYALSTNKYLFYLAVLLASFKDIFAPITFAYKYEIFGKFGNELSRSAIAVLESFTSIVMIIMPLIIGRLWMTINSGIFIIAAICIFLSVVLGLFLPSSATTPGKE